jgi:pimeloyl-ACP methyl ester carboxylesterase
MPETLQLRLHGPPSLRTLVFLPGLHGDWTLIAGFRKALGERVRFAEVTYPRTLTWSLDDYAAGVETALAEHGITRGWLLGESFSSQVVWPIVARKRFMVEGVILAGGFVRHPIRWAVRMAERVCGSISLGLLTRILFGYARLARFRFRRSPEVRAGLNEFLARRTALDQQAAKHRLHLLTRNDPCAIAREASIPIYGLTGLFDPIVPWFFVRRWLRRNCPQLREYKIIWHADHNVLGTASRAAAEQVLVWMTQSRAPKQ